MASFLHLNEELALMKKRGSDKLDSLSFVETFEILHRLEFVLGNYC
jgi:hypothetical protein